MEQAKNWIGSLFVQTTKGAEVKGEKTKPRTPGHVTVKELPMYPSAERVEYQFVEEDALPCESTISRGRQAIQKRFSFASQKLDQVQESADQAKESMLIPFMGFMKEEGLAKAVAITIGGMGGFLLGIRRGGVIRQVFYSGVGMSAMASFCYPNETVDLLRASVQYGKRQWVQFKQPPQPAKDEEQEVLAVPGAGLVNPNENIDMYSTRSSKIS